MNYRFPILLLLVAATLFSQIPTAGVAIVPDPEDSGIVRAMANLQKVRSLVESGALARVRLKKAEEELQDAFDMSLLRQTLYSKDITVEQSEQMIGVAERMVFRRNKALLEAQNLVSSGVLSRAEAESTAADLDRAQKELDWAIERAKLVAKTAEIARLQLSIASLEIEVEQHPDWIGTVAEKYSGSGIFTMLDLQKLEIAFLTKFAKQLPISANGETAVHKSLGFDHRGRVDVALNPDQLEGKWLRQYLMIKKIPYFAFRAAVAHKATGAHIHIGPQSSRLSASLIPPAARAGSDATPGR